jgi:hypothetical protein
MVRHAQRELERRQQLLLIRSAELRVTLAHQARALQAPLALADQLRAGAQWLRRHPLWPAAALVLLAWRRPRRILVWVSRLSWGWRLYRRVRHWAQQA